MANRIRLLGAGAITSANTVTDIYEVPSDALGSIVNNIRLTNRNTAGSSLIEVFLKKGSATARLIYDWKKSVAVNDIVTIKPEFTLEPGDKLQVRSSRDTLDWVVSGMEKIS